MKSSQQQASSPYFSFREVIELLQVSDMEATTILHELVMLEELAGTYTKKQLDCIWCALIDRFDKLERMEEILEMFSLS